MSALTDQEREQIQSISDTISRVDERTSIMYDLIQEFKGEQEEQDKKHDVLQSRVDKFTGKIAGALAIVVVIFGLVQPFLQKAIAGD